MKTYIFKTVVTMKEYNRDKWWIDADIIKDTRITAYTIKDALTLYAEHAAKNYITITKNALKTKSAMYKDTNAGAVQIGYVITGSTDFEKDNYQGWCKQYIDLWVEVLEINVPDFGKVA